MKTFYLGTHHPHWLKTAGVPLFISRRSLTRLKRPPRAIERWALDSGGFTELSQHGRWTTTPADYAMEVKWWQQTVGMLDWAAPQDWMCEPAIRKKTGRTVREHQLFTTTNYVELLNLAPELPWIPVLQGWTLGEYMDHIEMYNDRGIDLTREALVGLGSVCRRQDTTRVGIIVRWLADEGITLHGFGLKITGLRDFGELIHSADSMAWSLNARKNPPLEGCRHKSCSNCMLYAKEWLRGLQTS